MARLLYGCTSGDYTLSPSGRIVPNTGPLPVYDTRVGGPRVTDMLDIDGKAITAVTSDPTGLVGVYAPDGRTTPMWLEPTPAGPRVALRPVDPPSAGGGAGGGSVTFVSVRDHGALGDGTTDDTAAIQSAITAAGDYGTVFFPRTAASYLVSSSLKPRERQTWLGEHSPRYAWDLSVTGGSIIRAATSFTGTALVHNTATVARGVTLRNLGIFGNGEDGPLRAVDLGPASGSERAWVIDNCQIMYAHTGICGFAWASTFKNNHISRCGYGIRPSSGADPNSRLNDTFITNNFIYFNHHGGIYLDGAVESGLVNITSNRVERSGTWLSGDSIDPNANRDENACGIFISRATCVALVGNSTDANASSGLKIDAVSHGLVNNVTSTGNVWKRDGTGDNAATVLPGVHISDAMYAVFIGDVVTYGDPNDSGPGRAAPQIGLLAESNDFFSWNGSVQLATNTDTIDSGYQLSGNYQSNVFDVRRGAALPVNTDPAITITDPVSEIIAKYEIDDDGSDRSYWPDRLSFRLEDAPGAGTHHRTGYFDRYGQLRAEAALPDSVALRVSGYFAGSIAGQVLFAVTDNRNSNVDYFRVADDYITLYRPVNVLDELYMNSHQINQLADPTSNQDAATKGYVDNLHNTPQSLLVDKSTIGVVVDRADTVTSTDSDMTQVRYKGTRASWTNECGLPRAQSPVGKETEDLLKLIGPTSATEFGGNILNAMRNDGTSVFRVGRYGGITVSPQDVNATGARVNMPSGTTVNPLEVTIGGASAYVFRIGAAGGCNIYAGLNMQNTAISNLANPVNAQDAVTKASVKSIVAASTDFADFKARIAAW